MGVGRATPGRCWPPTARQRRGPGRIPVRRPRRSSAPAGAPGGQITPESVYRTNAVKHFRFTPRGKRARPGGRGSVATARLLPWPADRMPVEHHPEQLLVGGGPSHPAYDPNLRSRRTRTSAGSRSRVAKLVQQRLRGPLEELLLTFAADLDNGDVGEVGFPEGADRLDDRVQVRPIGIDSATSSGRTNSLAPTKLAVVGSSAFTDRPPPNQRSWSCATRTASSRSGPQLIGIWPTARAVIPICGAPLVAFQVDTSSGLGSTAMRWSTNVANRWTDFSPDTAAPTCTGCSGRS